MGKAIYQVEVYESVGGLETTYGRGTCCLWSWIRIGAKPRISSSQGSILIFTSATLKDPLDPWWTET